VSTGLWSEERVCWGRRERIENPVMTIPIKEWINTGCLLKRMAAIYVVKSQISDRTNEDDQPVDSRIECTMC